MSIEIDEIKETSGQKQQISPIMFDFIMSITDVKNIEQVHDIYMSLDEEKFEIYVFYDVENFEIEDKIMKIFTDFESSHKFFPEIFIYPLNLIADKKMALPDKAVVI